MPDTFILDVDGDRHMVTVDMWRILRNGRLDDVWPRALPEPARSAVLRSYSDLTGIIDVQHVEYAATVIATRLCGMPVRAAAWIAAWTARYPVEFAGWAATATGGQDVFELPARVGLALAWRYVCRVHVEESEALILVADGWRDKDKAKIAGALSDLRYEVFADPDGGDSFAAEQQAKVDALFADLVPGQIGRL